MRAARLGLASATAAAPSGWTVNPRPSPFTGSNGARNNTSGNARYLTPAQSTRTAP